MSAVAYKNTAVTQPRDSQNCSHQLHEETTQPDTQKKTTLGATNFSGCFAYVFISKPKF